MLVGVGVGVVVVNNMIDNNNEWKNNFPYLFWERR